MDTVLTKEQRDLMEDIRNNHADEYRRWAEDNVLEITKRYDNYESMSLDEILMVAYECAESFMNWKLSKVV